MWLCNMYMLYLSCLLICAQVSQVIQVLMVHCTQLGTMDPPEPQGTQVS